VKRVVEGLREAAGLFKGESPVFVNRAFLRLFALTQGHDFSLSELLFPPPNAPGLFEAQRLKPLEPPLNLSGILLPLGGDRRLLILWEKEEGARLREERLAAMGKLAGEIAHEINNPLGGILLYSNLLKEDLPPESPLHTHVEKIIKLATRCRIIAKALLGFGRPEGVHKEPVNLNVLLKEMYDLVSDYRVLRRIKPYWHLRPDLSPVQAVKPQLEQVVLNLIINAGEAMEGRGEIHFETGQTEKEVFFEVRDTGPGIPEDILPLIFEPFFTTKKSGKGTGLGLSICHGIVKQHGGRIEVRNLKPRGAAFRVFLPLKGDED